jgi:hypothetical protein
MVCINESGYYLCTPFQTPRVEKEEKGPVVQLVRMPACHAGGRGFESRPDRKSLQIERFEGFFVCRI